MKLLPLLLLTAGFAAAQSPAKPAQPNAAEIYRRAFVEVARVLQPDGEEPMYLPFLDEEPSVATFCEDPWPALVEQAAVARTLFAQATKGTRCHFDKKVEAPMTELTVDLPALRDMQQLVIAAAWQQLPKDPASAARTACELLDHAMHLGADPSPLAPLLAFGAERDATVLLGATIDKLPRDDEGEAARRRTLTRVQRHVARRPDRKALAVHVYESTRALLDWAVDEHLQKDAAPARKQLMGEARRITLAKVHALLAPMRADEAPKPKEYEDFVARTIAAWKQAVGKRSIEKALEDLDVDTAEPLANVLCLLVAPRPVDMLKEHRRATEALRECVEKLERRAR